MASLLAAVLTGAVEAKSEPIATHSTYKTYAGYAGEHIAIPVSQPTPHPFPPTFYPQPTPSCWEASMKLTHTSIQRAGAIPIRLAGSLIKDCSVAFACNFGILRGQGALFQRQAAFLPEVCTRTLAMLRPHAAACVLGQAVR